MKINLSKREKKLIAFLTAIAFLYVFYIYIVSPLTFKIEETRQELEIKKMEHTNLITNIGSKNRVVNEFQDLTLQLEESYKGYFTHIDDEQMVLLINELSNKSNIEINSMDFSPGSAISVDKTIVNSILLDLSLSGNYLEISKFIDLLDSYNKRIIISSLSIYSISDQLYCYVSLEFYSLSNIIEHREEIYSIEKDINNTRDPFRLTN